MKDAQAGVQFKNVMGRIKAKGVTEVMGNAPIVSQVSSEKMSDSMEGAARLRLFGGQPRLLSPHGLWLSRLGLWWFPFDDAATPLN